MGMPQHKIGFDYIRPSEIQCQTVYPLPLTLAYSVSMTSWITRLYFPYPVRFTIILKGVMEIMTAINNQNILNTVKSKSLQIFKTAV